MSNLPLTLGIELESIITSREGMIRALHLETKKNPRIKSITRDASVESLTCAVGKSSSLFLGNRLVRQSMGRLEQITGGYEIVTNPLELDVMRTVINQILTLQVQQGEIFSERSSIHVHAGFPEGLIFNKGAIAMGLKVEPLLYKIAGMGTQFRGLSNHSAYCRPLALPPAARLRDSDRFAVLSPERAINADSNDSFWSFFGIRSGDRERYNPLRYFGVNIFSTLLRGTLEFRVFNFCTVSKHVQAIAGLVQYITDLVIRMPLKAWNSVPEVSIFESNPDSSYHLILDTLLDLGRYYDTELPISNVDVDNIRELIRITPQPVFAREIVQSHISSGRITETEARLFGLEIVSTAIPAGIIDIHNFANSDRTLLEKNV